MRTLLKVTTLDGLLMVMAAILLVPRSSVAVNPPPVDNKANTVTWQPAARELPPAGGAYEQPASNQAPAADWDRPGRVGMPTDWSNRHVIYTNGGSPQQRAAAMSDPRAFYNWMSRTFHPGTLRPPLDREPAPPPTPVLPILVHGPANSHSHIDWSVSLGNNGGMPIGETPAKYVFDVNQAPSCQNDFVVFVINATPSVGGQANIVALNNLYSGSVPSTGICGSGSATFMWSYASGTGAIFLSPALSLNGKKVAYIEAASSGRAVFHVLTWVAGQGTNATTGAVAPGSGGSSDVTVDFTNITTAGCTASGAGAGNASPYIDYAHDAAFVADANGRLYRIKNVFQGTPALDFCITVTAGQSLTSPVYDSNTNKVFISDGAKVLAYAVGAGSFTAAGSVTVAGTAGSIILSPILDSSDGFIYVFSSHNNANNHSIVSQIPLSLASHTDVNIGAVATGFASVLDGAFDNAYYESGPSAGTLYACGMQAGSGTKPALYSMSFQANGTINTTPVMNGNTHVNNAANSNGSCSPLAEFYDGTNDRLFVGAGNNSGTGGANQVTMWNINSRLTSTATTPNATAANEIGGSSGITIDNNSSQAQASSIYFGTLQRSASAPCGNHYCAVKLTQGALQ